MNYFPQQQLNYWLPRFFLHCVVFGIFEFERPLVHLNLKRFLPPCDLIYLTRVFFMAPSSIFHCCFSEQHLILLFSS